MQIRNPECLLLPEHLLLLVGFAIPLRYERPVFSGHLFLRLPCPYATPPFLHHIHFSHIGDEFGRNECGGLTFLHTQNGDTLMSRDHPRPKAPSEIRLEPLDEVCRGCTRRLWLAYHRLRTVATLDGLVRLRLVIRRCANPECEFYGHSHQLEEEGAFALPQGEFGLDVIALVGALRHAEHRSVPEIHRELLGRGLNISERTVTNLSGMSRIRRLLARIREAYRSRQSGDDEVIYRYSF